MTCDATGKFWDSQDMEIIQFMINEAYKGYDISCESSFSRMIITENFQIVQNKIEKLSKN